MDWIGIAPFALAVALAFVVGRYANHVYATLAEWTPPQARYVLDGIFGGVLWGSTPVLLAAAVALQRLGRGSVPD
jgi:hypothetical protein